MEKVRELLEEAKNQLRINAASETTSHVLHEIEVVRTRTSIEYINQAIALLPPVCKTCKGTGEVEYPEAKQAWDIPDAPVPTGPCPDCKQKPEASEFREAEQIIELATSINAVVEAERNRWRSKLVDAQKEREKMRQGWESAKAEKNAQAKELSKEKENGKSD